jgi:hypothetical protein
VPANTSSNAPATVSVDAVDDVTWQGAAYSKSGTCFLIQDNAGTGGGGTVFAKAPSDGTDCTGDAATAPGFTKTGWQ